MNVARMLHFVLGLMASKFSVLVAICGCRLSSTQAFVSTMTCPGQINQAKLIHFLHISKMDSSSKLLHGTTK